jgi:hypothetical protein
MSAGGESNECGRDERHPLIEEARGGLSGAAALFFAQRKWARSRDRLTARVRPVEL